MSRGHGVVQRFILDYLRAGHPEPDKRSSFDFPRKRRPVLIGHPLWAIAAAYAEQAGRPMKRDPLGRPYASRSTMASFGRAMATLRTAGLVEVRHKYDTPHLRCSPGNAGAEAAHGSRRATSSPTTTS